LEAEILLSYKTIREAKAIAKAVAPDNVKVPKGLVIKTERQGRRVLTKVKCGKLLTFIATIDDLISSVSVAERSVSAVRRQ